MPRPKKSFEDKLWSRVTKRGPSECWEWTGTKSGPGYGHMTDGRKKTVGVHRVSFFLANGSWPEVVMHSCDNPSCCNPAHLVAGTAKDNISDMRRKNRGNNFGRGVMRPTTTGSLNPSALLNETKVREILLSNLPQKRLAANYGVSRRCISFIKNRLTWRHVTLP